MQNQKEHGDLGWPCLPTEIIGNIGRYLDFKSHTVLRSTCSSVRCFVPRLKVVGFAEFKALVDGFGITPDCYFESPERVRIFQEWINLDIDHRMLTEEHVEYLTEMKFHRDLCRISRVLLDDPATYKDIALLSNDGSFLAAAASVDDMHLFNRLFRVPNMESPYSRYSSMYFAAAGGHLDIVQFLIPSMTSECGNIAISLAAANGHLAVMHALLQDTRFDPTSDDNVAILVAAGNGHLDVVQALLEDGRIDPRSSENWAVLFASENGHLSVVQALLVDGRADPIDSLISASKNGHLEVVKALLQDVRVDPTAHNNSALRESAETNHYGICSLLLTDPRVLALYRSDPFDIPDGVIIPRRKAIRAPPSVLLYPPPSGTKADRRANAKRN